MLAPSWLLIALALGVLGAPTFARVLPGAGTTTIVLAAAAVPVMLLLSVLAHELCHGIAGHAVGVPPTRYVLTLWGGHTQFATALPTPGKAAVVSLAGPAANVVLALLAWVAWRGLDPVDTPVLALLVQVAMLSNAVIAVFNLLPGLPMDGGQALEALVWRLTGDRLRGMAAAGWGGRAVVVLLVAVVLLRPLAEGRRPSVVTVLWVVLISGYLWSAASRTIATAHARRRAAGLDLRMLAEPALGLPAAGALTSLAGVPTGHHVVLLTADGRPAALLDPAAAAAVPPQLRETTPLTAVAHAVPREAVLTQLHGGAGVAAAAQGARHAASLVLVEQGQVRGVLTVARLEQALAPRRGR